jgi:cobalt-zinc-cadmium efflux system protein
MTSPEHNHRHDQEHVDGHAGHSPGVSVDADRRWLSIALAPIVVFMAGEVVVGVLAHPLALLSDAAHMLTDAASIVLALVAMRRAARPPAGGYTYGLKRRSTVGRPVRRATSGTSVGRRACCASSP